MMYKIENRKLKIEQKLRYKQRKRLLIQFHSIFIKALNSDLDFKHVFGFIDRSYLFTLDCF
jgi:hypothetical protein